MMGSPDLSEVAKTRLGCHSCHLKAMGMPKNIFKWGVISLISSSLKLQKNECDIYPSYAHTSAAGFWRRVVDVTRFRPLVIFLPLVQLHRLQVTEAKAGSYAVTFDCEPRLRASCTDHRPPSVLRVRSNFRDSEVEVVRFRFLRIAIPIP